MARQQTQNFSLQPANQVNQSDIRWVMRKLWMEHVLWTRLFIVSALGDLADAKDTAARLMKNQKDIGDVVGMFYPNAANQVTALLTQHIMIASQLVEAAKNKQDINEIRKQWYANADQVANLFQSVNPGINLRQHLYAHLQLTEGEILNRISGNYQNEITFFDNAMNQSVEMADIISVGLQSGVQNTQMQNRNNQQRNNFKRR